MPSTYTQNLGIEKPATGEQAGVWGSTVNNDFDYFDQGIDGSLAIALSASSYNLNTSQGVASQGRNKVIVWTGGLTAQATVNITPQNAQKIYFMQNATSGGFPILFQQGTGAGFLLQPGCSAMIYCDGAGATASVKGANYNPQFGSVLVAGALTVQGALAVQQPSTFTQPVTMQGATTISGALTTSGNVTINVPGSTGAAGDVYYRSSAGPLAVLPVGAAGQVLTVAAGPSLTWTTPGASVGNIIVGSTPSLVYFANASNQLAQDTWVRIGQGLGLGLGVTPAHTLHVGINYLPEIWIDGNAPATQNRVLCFATSGTARWKLLTPVLAESSPTNVGSNLALVAYNDAGTLTGNVMSWWRANGNVTIGALGDQGAKLAVLASSASQPGIMVKGVASQAYLQTWQDSTGAVVASIDGSGRLFMANSSFLTTSAPTGRLDLYGVHSSHPAGTIHIGPEPSGSLRSSIAMEAAVGTPDIFGGGLIRIYHRNGNLIVQFYYNGNNYWLYVPLTGGAAMPAQWYYSLTAM